MEHNETLDWTLEATTCPESFPNSLIGKTVRVDYINCGSCPKDKRWEGYIGKVARISKCPDGYQIWLENMSVSLLTKCDKYTVVG